MQRGGTRTTTICVRLSAGPSSASLALIVYSVLLDTPAFVVTNALILASAPHLGGSGGDRSTPPELHR